jgi:excisionase family DNA binding protein
MRDHQPDVLGGGEAVLVWGGTCGELAGALELLAAFLAGRQPPGGVAAYRRLSRHLEAVQTACAAAAREQQQARHRELAKLAAASAEPSPIAQPLLPSAQAGPVSDSVTVAEAADLLGLSHERIRQLAASGRIRGQRTARRVWMLERSSVASQKPRRHRSSAHGSKSGH